MVHSGLFQCSLRLMIKSVTPCVCVANLTLTFQSLKNFNSVLKKKPSTRGSRTRLTFEERGFKEPAGKKKSQNETKAEWLVLIKCYSTGFYCCISKIFFFQFLFIQ